ncbi:cation transporter [Clostridium sp. YIM B02505]|uniref:Cation transporter n=1 Tax=Clostridium yunnanense TaxID=2800325 RepID=A0ABS1EX12_9CLOT|nr:cation diffusion facilitator family transporter [Clostridium yunnanense]MBK1813921.1 cation transporter [Clostridium yunnanense]
MSEKNNVAKLSIISNSIIIILKIVFGIFTGSVSIMSEAIHSSVDLVAAIIAFISVKLSGKPADEEHPYGHGKMENVSGVIEALLIFVAAFWIIFEAAKKVLSGITVESVGVGFVVMFISAVINFYVSGKLYKASQKYDSIALKADALHLKTDVYTSLGVGGGLLMIWITGLNFLDPIIAILVALFICKEAFELLRDAFNPILDSSLSEEDLIVIKSIMENYKDSYTEWHELRTRKAGSQRYVDIHLVLDENITLKEASKISKSIENDIESKLKNCNILIKLETLV